MRHGGVRGLPAGLRLGLTTPPATLVRPGGALRFETDADGRVWFNGLPVRVFVGVVPDGALKAQ